MEWPVPINSVLKSEVTKLDNTLIPTGFQGDMATLRAVQDMLTSIIDQLGQMSASVQGLNKVITTGKKMQCSENILYLLKDATGNAGKGEVIGLLKVGSKHLYLNDEAGKLYEVKPLCVLDFFVRQDRQRRGLGKKLFDYMLQDLNTPPQFLAVDGPSPVMLRFLEKSYGMKNMSRHSNNFAVAATFFEDLPNIKSTCSTPASKSSGAGRYTARQPASGISTIIHGSHASAAPGSRSYRTDYTKFY